jgi:hypothetical protein
MAMQDIGRQPIPISQRRTDLLFVAFFLLNLGFITYQGESWILDSPEGVCPGQAWSEYPATSVLFSMWCILSSW